jgi:hypothetical protein
MDQCRPPPYDEAVTHPSRGAVDYDDFALALSLALDDMNECTQKGSISKLPANSDFFVALDLADKKSKIG